MSFSALDYTPRASDEPGADAHRCGLCTWARWENLAPGYYHDIKGCCDHPRARLMPRPSPLEIGLQSGRTCRFYAEGGNAPKRRME